MTNPVENILVDWCVEHDATVAVAESCTGGLIAHRITNVPGASAIFNGGIVSYANSAKVQLLQVPEEILVSNGAVSEPVALAMATGVRRALNSTYSVAVTGIAGPEGGTEEKPVGTVYMAVAGPSGAIAFLHHFSGTREAIKIQTADAALSRLLQLLEEQ